MIDRDYLKAIEQAKANYQDLLERGNDAIGDDWEDVKKELFTAEEIAESELKAMIISELIGVRRNIKQSQLEKSLDAVGAIQKLLLPLGKKLAVVSA